MPDDHDALDGLATAVTIAELMSAADALHAQALDRAAEARRSEMIRKAVPFARTLAARFPAGTPLWLNLVLHAHEEFVGIIGYLAQTGELPKDVAVEIVSFSVDRKPQPVAPKKTRDEGFCETTQDMTWTEAIPLDTP